MLDGPLHKLQCFEYLILKFAEWHSSLCPSEDSYLALNKLKLFKLHFFASAVNADRDNEGLLDIFDNFYALPYGPVESDIYDNLHRTQIFEVLNNKVVLKDDDFSYFDNIEQYKPILDKSVKSLQLKNNTLVTYNAIDLVEISHKWYSWKSVFHKARSVNKFSLPISRDIIKKEAKYFSL